VHLEKALSAFELRQPLPAGLESSRITSFVWLHYGLFEIGYPDRAWATSREMLEAAQRSSEPFMLAQASCFVAFNSLIRGDGTAAQKHAEEAIALIEPFGFPTFLALAISVNGAALIGQGRYEEGLAVMDQGLSAFRATGGMPFAILRYHLAYGLGRIGRPQEGLKVVEDGFASSAKTGEHLSTPSLHHIKGQLLLAQNPSDVSHAEQCFRKGSRSPGGKVRDQPSCVPPRASRGCCATPVDAIKRARRSPRFTAGSPKASTPPI
jgi:hypothetical protein